MLGSVLSEFYPSLTYALDMSRISLETSGRTRARKQAEGEELHKSPGFLPLVFE